MPKVCIEYEQNDDLFTCATVARDNASCGLASESLWSYEVGIKATMLDQQLRLNVAAFRMTFDNIVVQSFGAAPESTAIGFFTHNAGKARVEGIEADLEWWPVQRLTVGVGLGLLKRKFLEFGIDVNSTRPRPAPARSLLTSYRLPRALAR